MKGSSSMERRFLASVFDAHEHIAPEALERFVDGTVGRAEEDHVREHVAVCATCSAELEDMRSFATAFASTARPNWYWAAAAAAAAAVIVLFYFPRNTSTQSVAPRVAIHDGSAVITLDTAGQLRGAPPSWRPAIREALLSGRLPSKRLPFAAPSSDVLRGNEPSSVLRVVRPLDEIVFEDKPLFEWSSTQPSASYEVEIFDARFQRVMRSPRVTTLSWTADHTLPRGVELQWQVSAMREGEKITAPQPPAPPARFFVVDASSAREIESARAAQSHLALAIAYARSGMRDAARDELQALSAQNPRSETIAKLIRSLRN